MGIKRSAENPNLCSRCGSHLAAGEIRPAVHVLLELNDTLRFGQVPVDDLSRRELPALIQQLRARMEDQGGLVLPADSLHPLRLSIYFNAPVLVDQPALHAWNTLRSALHWLSAELNSLALGCTWRGILSSGFVEVVECEGPIACYPMGEVTFRAADQLQHVGADQLACDAQTLVALCQQDASALSDLLGDDPVLPREDSRALVTLIDQRQDRALTPPAASNRAAALMPASSQSQLGALLLALIAAPCAAMVVIGNGAVAVGLGAVFAALLPLWKWVGMSIWPRVLITLAALLVAIVNLLRAELAQKRFRQLQRQVGERLRLPRSQRVRLRTIRWSSSIVVALVLLEGLLRVLVMNMPLL